MQFRTSSCTARKRGTCGCASATLCVADTTVDRRRAMLCPLLRPASQTLSPRDTPGSATISAGRIFWIAYADSFQDCMSNT